MANTLAEVYNRVYQLMAEKATSTTYPVAFVVAKINEKITAICKGQVVSLLNPQVRYRAGRLKFLQRTAYYTNIVPQGITVATTAGATVLVLPTTTYPASGGKILLNGEIVSFTGKDSTQLTGVTGVTTSHRIGSLANLVFALPDNMSKPFAVYDVYGKAITSSDYRAGSHGKFYSVVTDNSNVDYIFFSTSTVGNFIVLYFVKPPALAYGVDDTTEIILPDYAGVEMIAPLVAGELKLTMGEETDIAQNNLNMGYASLQAFYDYYSKSTIDYTKGVPVGQPSNPIGAGLTDSFIGNNNNV